MAEFFLTGAKFGALLLGAGTVLLAGTIPLAVFGAILRVLTKTINGVKGGTQK